ncbi:MAG: hypothetical protein ABSD08_22190 [Xanthobacteraceae bacterium]|jgi:hypothetical protein
MTALAHSSPAYYRLGRPLSTAKLTRIGSALGRAGERVLRLHKGGHIYSLLATATPMAGIDLAELQLLAQCRSAQGRDATALWPRSNRP